MKIKLVALILTLVTAFAHAPVVTAQNTNVERGWSTLQAVPAGTKLSIKTKSGETVKGELRSVTDKGLTLSHKNKTIELERDNIQKAYRESGRSVGKATLIGLGAGAGIGAAIGGAIGAGRPHESGEGALPALMLGTGGAIIGTVTGLVTGLLRNKQVLVYEAK